MHIGTNSVLLLLLRQLRPYPERVRWSMAEEVAVRCLDTPVTPEAAAAARDFAHARTAPEEQGAAPSLSLAPAARDVSGAGGGLRPVPAR